MRKEKRVKKNVKVAEENSYIGNPLLKEFVPAKPRTANQAAYLNSIIKNSITIATGYAGTGKTLLGLSAALDLINKYPHIYNRIVVIRPYIPTNMGEKIGALPGELKEKVGPFVESIKDNLRTLVPENRVTRICDDLIEFSVLSLCRGRSFSNCIIMVEEAQNVPIDGGGMKMLFTRIGEKSKLILSGDLDQCDIPWQKSDLSLAINKLTGLNDVGIIEMKDYNDIQRNPLIREILKRYNG